MKKQDDILKTGTLYWLKGGRRGSVPVPIEFLNNQQKQTLCTGLESNRYPLYINYQTLNAHYVWVEENDLYEVLVTDIVLSSETKRKLNTEKNVPVKTAYRLNLSDMMRLKNEFISGVVDETFVKNTLSLLPWKPWQQTDWKLKRDLKIKNACENCGVKENLILQHTIQPRKFNKIIFELVGEHYEEFQFYIKHNINEIELPLSENTEKVPVCPKCGSSRVRFRIRKGNYICKKSRNSVICKYEFITPDFGYDERMIHLAEKKRLSILRDRFCLERGLYHKATEIAIEEIITYLNMDHTKTLCRKCAFIEDKPYLKL